MIRSVVIADDDQLVGNLPTQGSDILISLGDLFDSSIEKAFYKYGCKNAFAVKGNHDSDAKFADYITPLHFNIATYKGLTFGGFNGCWKYKDKGHHLYEQFEVSNKLRSFPRVDVFVAHNSPFGVHERDSEVHQGFEGFTEYIERNQPKYFLHGHQHCNALSKIGPTEIIGVYGETAIELKL